MTQDNSMCVRVFGLYACYRGRGSLTAHMTRQTNLGVLPRPSIHGFVWPLGKIASVVIMSLFINELLFQIPSSTNVGIMLINLFSVMFINIEFSL